MTNLSNRNRLDFYQNSKRGKLLRAMTLTDISFWGTHSFISVILILYVLQFIEGGSATHLGLAFLVFKATSAVFSIPIGRFFDKHKGHIDELWGLVFANFSTGIIYILLSFSTQLWQLYTSLFILGFLYVLNLTSWRVLFYNNIKKEEYGETVGAYQAVYSIGEGLALALGGFFGDTFGFDKVVLIGGIVIMFGSFIPLYVKAFVSSKQ